MANSIRNYTIVTIQSNLMRGGMDGIKDGLYVP